jgi:hypothetical protein
MRAIRSIDTSLSRELERMKVNANHPMQALVQSGRRGPQGRETRPVGSKSELDEYVPCTACNPAYIFQRNPPEIFREFSE